MTDEPRVIRISAKKWEMVQKIAALRAMEPEDLLQEYVSDGVRRDLSSDSEFILQQIESVKQGLLDAADAVRRRRFGDESNP